MHGNQDGRWMRRSYGVLWNKLPNQKLNTHNLPRTFMYIFPPPFTPLCSLSAFNVFSRTPLSIKKQWYSPFPFGKRVIANPNFGDYITNSYIHSFTTYLSIHLIYPPTHPSIIPSHPISRPLIHIYIHISYGELHIHTYIRHYHAWIHPRIIRSMARGKKVKRRNKG